MSTSHSIMQFDLDGLQNLMVELGQKPYRGVQLAEWIYLRGAPGFSSMNNLPQGLRDALAEQYVLKQPQLVQKLKASDGTTRYLLEFEDGERTETVAIPAKKRLTVCFSVQAGCALGCVFCATGSMGLSRSLSAGEMVSQLSIVASDYSDKRISNIVAMGQGEPFANYEASLSALRMMNSPDLFGVGARHITVSTSGLIKQIRRFAEEPEQFTLAVSLHSAEQRVRNRLMPGLESQPLDELKKALLFYMDKTSRRPSLEYALIEGVNDGKAALESLLAFCRVPAPGFHVNLLGLNTPDSPPEGMPRMKKAAPSAFKRFEEALTAAGVSVSRRASKGEDIAAACGQLACKSSS